LLRNFSRTFGFGPRHSDRADIDTAVPTFRTSACEERLANIREGRTPP